MTIELVRNMAGELGRWRQGQRFTVGIVAQKEQ